MQIASPAQMCDVRHRWDERFTGKFYVRQPAFCKLDNWHGEHVAESFVKKKKKIRQ